MWALVGVIGHVKVFSKPFNTAPVVGAAAVLYHGVADRRSMRTQPGSLFNKVMLIPPGPVTRSILRRVGCISADHLVIWSYLMPHFDVLESY